MGNISNPEQWATRERLRFIERVVYWRGSVQREEVAAVFNLSAQQISADLQKYQELCPGALVYSLKKKCYEGSAKMKCRLHVPNFDEAVGMFLEDDAGWKVDAMGDGFLRGAGRPSSLVGRITLPVRRAVVEVERRIFLAVLHGLRVRVKYRSVHGAGDEEWRWLCPRALGHDGYRWHVRAWAEAHGAFRDYVLSRMLAVEFPKEAAPELPVDEEWESWDSLTLVPNPSFTSEQQAALKLDFNVPDAGLKLNVRKAMLPYTLEHLRLPGAAWSGQPFLIPIADG
jgi:hypothetical protein